MKKIASELLVERLVDWGVEIVFGLPGDGINGITEGFRRHADRIRFVLVHHEEAAAFMATGYAKTTGKLGVCLATSGGGAIHLLNGLYDAKLDHTPVLAITGMQGPSLLGTGFQQEVHTEHLFADVAEYNAMVHVPGHIPTLVDKAVRMALSRRTVSHITFPVDIQEVPADFDPWSIGAPARPAETAPILIQAPGVPDAADLQRAAAVLNEGCKVVMLVGAGALGARAEVLRVAECLGSPIVKTLSGKAVVPDEHPLTTGGIGLLGTKPTEDVMDGADTLFMVGTNFPFTEHLPKAGIRTVQIEADPTRAGDRIPTEVPLIEDTTRTLNALLPLLTEQTDRGFLDQAQTAMTDWRARMGAVEGSDRDPIQPQYLMRTIDRLANDDAILSTDSGTIATWAARHYDIRGDREFMLSGNLATMAPGLPYAIAAQFAHPDRQCIAFVGDGGFAMLMAEFLTAARHGLPIKVFICNNGLLGQILWEQMALGFPEYGVRWQQRANFAPWAQACGGRGIHVDDPAQVEPAVAEALAFPGSALVNVAVNPDEPPMPASITYDQAKGFASSFLHGQPAGRASCPRCSATGSGSSEVLTPDPGSDCTPRHGQTVLTERESDLRPGGLTGPKSPERSAVPMIERVASAAPGSRRRPPIADYGFLSDCHSAALVDRAGSVDWWCVPRFDSPSVFGRLLGPDAGHWLLRPSEDFETERNYIGNTLVLRTVFRAAGGEVTITDALALERGARGHDVGFRSPHLLLRRVEGRSGQVEMTTELAPRMEYGRTQPHLCVDADAVVARGGQVTLSCTGPVRWQCADGVARAAFPIAAGDTVELRLSYTPSFGPALSLPEKGEPTLEDTLDAWESWSALHTSYDGCFPDEVRRSSLVLQGLTFQPSGAVVAAATTSLPERLGGELNFDYRFAWLRDLSLTIRALWVAACPDEPSRLFDWFATTAGHIGDELVQIMYGVDGERDLTEHVLEHLAGYHDSRPVRVGNAAWQQQQLDVLGEVLDVALLLREQIGDLDHPVQDMLVTLADRAADGWAEPDAGMWEARDQRRQYVSSKVMCWVALDRAVQLAPGLGASADPARWAAARDEVRAAVLDQAWSRRAGAYAGAFASDDLDASVLLLPVVGFLPASDPRMWATIEAIERELGDGGLVRRWPDDPSGFLICTYWLVECLALGGATDRAIDWFQRATAHANDLGLLAEEADPDSGLLLGNFPQAFSHVGLINAAWRLGQSSTTQPGVTQPGVTQARPTTRSGP